MQKNNLQTEAATPRKRRLSSSKLIKHLVAKHAKHLHELAHKRK